MFTDIRGIIIDKYNRYLNMKDIVKDIPSWKQFTEWETNEDGYLVCIYAYNSIYTIFYHNIFADLQLCDHNLTAFTHIENDFD